MLNTEINVVKSDSINFLRKNNSQFHLIFADPPYEIQQKIYKIIIDLIVGKLLTNGMLIIEHNKKIDLVKEPGYYMSRKYGDSVISFFNSNFEKAGL